jgi:hypothetical protein
VHHADSLPGDLDHSLARQSLAQAGLVHVPVHGFDRRAEGAEVFGERGRREVSRVQDDVRLPEQSDARIGERPRPAWQVGVRDDRDASQGASRTASTSLAAP